MKKNLLLVLLLLLLTKVASAYDFEVGGIYYNVNGDELTVTYASTYYYNSYSGDVIIPENVTYGGTNYTVTAIGYHAFYNCTGLTNIEIPNSVNCIDKTAFNGSLLYEDQPDGVVYIDDFAYKYKGNMAVGTRITLKDGTRGIANGAFYECSNLQSINMPTTVSFIGDEAFRFCSGLSSINLPNSLISIGWCAFDGCTSLTDILIPNSVKTISAGAFSTTGITSIEVPNSVNAIEACVFYQCYELRSVKLPNTIKYFGREAFCACRNLLSIEIPNSVDSIGPEAFYQCKQLTHIEIPNSVKSIGDWAFYNCSGLRSIVIPNSVTTLGKSVFNSSGMKVTLCGNIETVGTNVFSSVSTLFISSKVSTIPAFGFSPSQIYCYGSIPPSCQEGTFSSYTGTLHVPASSLASYFIAPIWEHFNNISGDAVSPQSINLSQTAMEIYIGEQTPLIATIIPSNAYPNEITWISTNTGIATVSNGIVSALAIGECDIIASCLDVQSICHVVVKSTTITISLDQNDVSMLPNHIITLTASSSSDLIPDLVVTSSDPTVAAARVVNNSIQVVGIKEGTTTIKVSSVDGTAIPAICLVTVYTEIGDMNSDGFVNISDVTSLIDYLLNGDSSQISTKNADVNGDGHINISDVTALIDALLSDNG